MGATPAPGKLEAGVKDIIPAEALQDDAVETAKIKDDAVTKAKFAGGVFKSAIIDGGAAGDHTVTGIAVGDNLVMVLHITTKAAIATMADLTSEFTVGADKINNTDGTATTDDQLLIFYEDLT